MSEIAEEIVLPYGGRRKEIPSQEILRECFDYHPDGHLIWKVRPRKYFCSDKGWKTINGRDAGKIAGGLKSCGKYITVKICDEEYFIHRVIWSWHNGPFDPTLEVDHIDLNGLNNKIENLRLISAGQNMYNRPVHKRKKSGYPKGVSKRGSTFVCEIKFNKKRIYLGTFKTPEEAGKAYEEAAKRLHGEFARFEVTPST